MADARKKVRDHFGFDFPAEFFEFAKVLKRLPAGALGEVCDMWPGYAFGLAGGLRPAEQKRVPLARERYFNDLPEFVTLFHGTTDGLHFGYYFDAPGETAPVVVHVWPRDGMDIYFTGDTLFDAVRWQLESQMELLDEQLEYAEDADESEHARNLITQGEDLRKRLVAASGDRRQETKLKFVRKHHKSGWRKPVAPTKDRLGILIPKPQYQKLSADVFAQGEPPDPAHVAKLAGEAQKRLAAGKPGAALKLGRDLWGHSEQFPICYDLLAAAYAALERPILVRRLKDARKSRAAMSRR